ncbi:MAG: hypothetical protein ACFFDN_35165, partial [Candidatus Hodarchaeota archaeon]
QGVYQNARKTIEELMKFSKGLSNINVNIASVIMPDNLKEIPLLLDSLASLPLKNYTYSAELVRPATIEDKYVHFPNPGALKQLYHQVIKFKEKIFSSKLQNNLISKTFLSSMHYANIYTLYKVQYNYITQRKKWPMRCCAGFDVAVIYNNGEVSICELRRPICNTKEVKNRESFLKIIKSERKKSKNCYCTHLCYILPSMYRSKKMLFVYIPLAMLRYFLVKLRWLNYF